MILKILVLLLQEGIDVQKIRIPSQGQYRIDILAYGTGLDYNPKYAGIGSGIIEIGPSLPKTTTQNYNHLLLNSNTCCSSRLD